MVNPAKTEKENHGRAISGKLSEEMRREWSTKSKTAKRSRMMRKGKKQFD